MAVFFFEEFTQNSETTCIMSTNNSTPTQSNETVSVKYPTPELQAAYDAGRAIGRTEGMLSYQRHLMNQLFNENQKLNEKLREQKGGQQ